MEDDWGEQGEILWSRLEGPSQGELQVLVVLEATVKVPMYHTAVNQSTPEHNLKESVQSAAVLPAKSVH